MQNSYNLNKDFVPSKVAEEIIEYKFYPMRSASCDLRIHDSAKRIHHSIKGKAHGPCSKPIFFEICSKVGNTNMRQINFLDLNVPEDTWSDFYHCCSWSVACNVLTENRDKCIFSIFCQRPWIHQSWPMNKRHWDKNTAHTSRKRWIREGRTILFEK